MSDFVEMNSEETESLTNWKNPPSLRQLKQDYEDARPAHKTQVANIDAWLDNLHVRGKAKIKSEGNGSKIVPKLIRKQAEWRYAALTEPFLSSEDVFNVKPVTWEDREAAIQNQLILNNQFNTKINKVSFIDEYIRTAVDEGTVILRVGWEFDEEEYDKTVPVVEYRVNPETMELHEQLAQLRQESPSQYATDVPEELKQAHEMAMESGQPIEAVVIGEEVVKDVRTLVNRPTVEVCDYRNVLIDPTCLGNMDKAGFVVYSFESSLAELRKDKRYKNLKRINTANTSILATPDHNTAAADHNFNFQDEPRKKFVVHEYWGFWPINGEETALQPFVCSWVGDVMIRLEESPFPDKKLPFIAVQYLPIRKETYGEPDGALLEDNQKIYGAVMRGMIDIMGKSANGQTGVRKDALDMTNRRKFDKGQDYEFNPGVDPRQGIYMHTFPEIPNSAQFMLQLQNQEAESLTGVQSFSQGISGAAMGDVAAGVRGALDAASKRELGILRRLSDGLTKLGHKIISMNSEFLDDDEVIRITNDEFVQVRRDDLAGEFDLKLSISTAEEDNNKAQELAFMLQTMGNNMGQELSQMILADIAKLRKMPDLAKRIENYRPEPDPMTEKMKELELALLEAQVATEQSKAMMNQSTADLSQAKSGTEQVKQGNMQSDTDLKDLNFVEQESGVKQERELQKHGEQARSQAELARVQRGYDVEDRKFDLIKEYMFNKSK